MERDSILGLGKSVERSKCLVCQTLVPMPLYPVAIDYISNASFQVRQCPTCGVAWTNPVPGDLSQHYPRTYRRYNAPVLAILKFLYYRRTLRWSRRFSQPGRVLEFGCGDGFMLNALRSLGWNVVGTELTSEMAQFARDRFGLTVYVESEDSDWTGDKFDLIVLFQVLEHLQDPIVQLKRVASLLAPNGRVIVAVPNFSSWQAVFGKQDWFHLDVPRHLFHFSPDSLARAARESGLRLKRIEFVSFEHDPYGWVQSILNRSFGNKNRLTKLLMNMVPWQTGDIVSFVAAFILTPFGVLLALLSWMARRGAIIEVELAKD